MVALKLELKAERYQSSVPMRCRFKSSASSRVAVNETTVHDSKIFEFHDFLVRKDLCSEDLILFFYHLSWRNPKVAAEASFSYETELFQVSFLKPDSV